MSFLANLFGYILNYLYNYLQNYGLAIILFSIILKLIMLPLTIKQQISLKKTNKVQDEIKKLQMKYKNNPEMLNKEMMDVYKREKVSPFSGCLSSILQLFIFISVFYLVSRPLTYMKKVDPEIIKNYEQEISADSQASSYMEIRVIELKSSDDDRVYLNMNFLGLDLSKVPMQNWKDIKVFIIPLLYIITTFVNIRISTNMNSKKNKGKKDDKTVEVVDKDKEDSNVESKEEQMESMEQMSKNMNYMMPIMSVAIALVAPLGLSLYWLVSNVLQLIERFFINFFMNKKENKEANNG